MPPQSCASFAALVCPSAPFLAPRLLRGPLPVAALHAPCLAGPRAVRRQTYATKPGKKPRKGSKESSKENPMAKETYWSEKRRIRAELLKGQLTVIERFQSACETRDIVQIMQFYPSVLDSPMLSREDTRRVAQALHAHLRSRSKDVAKQASVLMPFVERIIHDVRTGKLPPHPAAFVHLLGMLKETKCYEQGYVFWQWLSEQDDTYVDQAVYGAAIELLAYRGKDSLQTLEDLYQDGLKRFPGTFAEYHLSPDAVVPDRTQPIAIPGIPMALLQGILTARILNRDWAGAYLALDTALRLYPTSVPQRFFELFMTERPLSEAYTIFALACRAGIVFKPNHLTSLLSSQLRPATHRYWALSERTVLLRAMANAIYAYLESGGTLEAPHVNAFFSSFSALLPYKPHGEDYSANEVKIRNQIIMSVHRMATVLVQGGFPPTAQLFTALLILADKLNVRELFTVTLHDLKASGVDLGQVGRRVMLHTAGRFGERELIEQYWTQITSLAEAEGSSIGLNDWVGFAKACRQAGCSDYFHQQLQGLKHAIDGATEEKALAALNHDDPPPRFRPYTLMSLDDFTSDMEEVEKTMNNVAAIVMSGQPLDVRKNPISMFIDPLRKSLGSEEDMRAIYDELTTDPHQPARTPDQQASPPVSSTGIPLDELRFQNWSTIIELMADAEATEAAFQRQLDEAIARGQPLDAVRYPVSFRSERSSVSEDTPESNTDARSRLRSIVRRLRSPQPPPVAQFQNRTLGSPKAAETVSSSQFQSTPTLRYHVSLEPTHMAPPPRAARA